MVNRYAGTCHYCKGQVPASGGVCWRYRGRWYVAHTTCSKKRKGGVDVYRIGGKEYTRNKAGRCEDAPCCGCCTI